MKARNLAESFSYARIGVAQALASERNLRVHFWIALAVAALAATLRVRATEAAALALAATVVIVAEMINTAIEHCVDMITPTTTLWQHVEHCCRRCVYGLGRRCDSRNSRSWTSSFAADRYREQVNTAVSIRAKAKPAVKRQPPGRGWLRHHHRTALRQHHRAGQIGRTHQLSR